MTGRDKDEKGILEPEADLFPKKTREEKKREDGERGQVKRPRPLSVGNGCNLVASFKNLFILKCVAKSRLPFHRWSNSAQAKCEFYKNIFQANTPEGFTTIVPNREVSSVTLKV